MTLPTTPANTILDELAAGRSIQLSDRARLGLDGLSIEDLLNEVATDRISLIQGSGTQLKSGTPLRMRAGKNRNGHPLGKVAFATDVAGIALVKALFDNSAGVSLDYPWSISSQTPLTVTIRHWRAEAERPSGYVYLVRPRANFKRDRNTWQWFTEKNGSQFLGGIEVTREDFRYPVYRA